MRIASCFIHWSKTGIAVSIPLGFRAQRDIPCIGGGPAEQCPATQVIQIIGIIIVEGFIVKINVRQETLTGYSEKEFIFEQRPTYLSTICLTFLITVTCRCPGYKFPYSSIFRCFS